MPHQVEINAMKTVSQDGIVEVSTAFLTEYFCVSRSALKDWVQRGCPKINHNRWDFIAVLKWRGGLKPVEDEQEDDASTYLRKLKADAFLKEQQGQLAEIDLQQRRGEVVPIAMVEQVLGGVIMNTKGLLMALPSKAAPRLMGLSAMEELKTILRSYIPALVKAKKAADVEGILEAALEDYREAETVAEINEILAILIHEALEELSGMDLSRFGAGDEDEEGGGAVQGPDDPMETAGED